MSAFVASIGSSSTVVGGQVTITVPVGGVPLGATIFVAVAHDANASSGSVADSKVNVPYSNVGTGKSFNSLATNGTLLVFRNDTMTTALVSGDIITYSLPSGATVASVTAWYAVGLTNNISVDVNNTAGGNSTSPSVTSGSPTQSGDLFMAVVGSQSTIASFTQDSTNGAWASPPGQVTLTGPCLAGGWLIGGPGLSTEKYNPTFGTSVTWAAIIIALFVDPTYISSDMGSDMPQLKTTMVPYR